MSREEAYERIVELAEYVNENRMSIPFDGMSIIIGIADDSKIKRMAMTGSRAHIMQMLGDMMHECLNPENIFDMAKFN